MYGCSKCLPELFVTLLTNDNDCGIVAPSSANLNLTVGASSFIFPPISDTVTFLASGIAKLDELCKPGYLLYKSIFELKLSAGNGGNILPVAMSVGGTYVGIGLSDNTCIVILKPSSVGLYIGLEWLSSHQSILTLRSIGIDLPVVLSYVLVRSCNTFKSASETYLNSNSASTSSIFLNDSAGWSSSVSKLIFSPWLRGPIYIGLPLYWLDHSPIGTPPVVPP